jgi:uncharacterized protein YbcC (UPF0753/DUF2309 family)
MISQTAIDPIDSPDSSDGARTSIRRVAEDVARLIPPLWDLNDYVAVNPFLGHAATPIARAAEQIGDAIGAQVLPPLAYFQQRLRDGRFDLADVSRAAQRHRLEADVVTSVLTGVSLMPTRHAGGCLTFAERFDAARGTSIGPQVLRWVMRWCGVYLNGAKTPWQLPIQELGLFGSWREAAEADCTPEMIGVRGWRRWVKRLPHEPAEALEYVLHDLPLEAADYPPYFYRLLGSVFGWASYFRRIPWHNRDAAAGDVLDLLAIVACVDAGVFHSLSETDETLPLPASRVMDDESVRLVFQDALEDGYVRTLVAGGLTRPVNTADAPRPGVQAAFCIDVRSEPLRRNLEAQHTGIRTIGFAGFFGVALALDDGNTTSARCPVLLKPAVIASFPGASENVAAFHTVKHLTTAPAAFSFMELVGWTYGLSLFRRSVPELAKQKNDEHAVTFRVNAEDSDKSASWKPDLAQSILKNMGLRGDLARLVVLCGHSGRSANNAHAAGLDCGACGGHGGAINARVAASLLNDPAVRLTLAERGVRVPDDTWFVPAVHDTSVDEVALFDESVPSTHAADIADLRSWLGKAAIATRRERAGRLGLSVAGSDEELATALQRRASDWSEVRPEWALARNAAFIAARRERTRGVNLDGRAFLHDYDAAADPDGSVLTLILTAPTVVASWINLQYLASTVDNRAFGCGDKALHNRVGMAGVVLGNGGDLRTGLPLQSVHAADDTWFHEPLRLQVIVEASVMAIDKVLTAHAHTRDLVENGWIRLFALDPNGTALQRRLPDAKWEAFKRNGDPLR